MIKNNRFIIKQKFYLIKIKMEILFSLRNNKKLFRYIFKKKLLIIQEKKNSKAIIKHVIKYCNDKLSEKILIKIFPSLYKNKD
jgi:hypothetical protein